MKRYIGAFKFSKLVYVILFLVICTISSYKMTAYAAEVSVSWDSVNLTADGDYSWNMSAGGPGTLVVDKYEIQLARKNNGTWSTNYKSFKTTDSYYSSSFSSKGQYYYKVRALFIGGDKSTWSQNSNVVSVTSDEVSENIGSGSSTVYVTQTVNGVTYAVPAGPGTGYVAQTSTIGPGGNYVTANNNTISSVPLNYSTNNNGTITGTNAASGWIREGNRWRYRYANNTYANNSMDHIGDDWYYFDANGYMVTGWVYYNSNWYLFGLDGRRKTGWNMVNEKWYYMNGGGIMQTGYVVVDGITYYCDQSGARLQGDYNPDGHYFDQSGVMIK